MPQIGWFELLIIVVIAILVIGPKDFPVVLRKIGTWIGSVKRYFSEVQNDMTKLTLSFLIPSLLYCPDIVISPNSSLIHEIF